MAADRIIVVDAGTSALRVLSVDRGGRFERLASIVWPMFVPDDAAPFGREFDVGALTAMLARIIDGLPASAAAVAFTGQREGIAFVDGDGAAVFASPNIDARASAEGMMIDAARGDRVYQTTGRLPSLIQAPAKLLWLREHRPAVAERVAAVLPLADWIASVCSGERCVSRSLAAENGLLDIVSSGVAAGLIADAGLDASLVPAVVSDGGVAGEAGGAPVVLAGADTQCALAASGAIAAGDVAVPAGWSAPLQMSTDAPVFDAEMRTWTGVHVVPRQWILESNAGEMGRAFDWACRLTGLTAEDGDALAAATPAGAGDVMTVLGARTMNAAQMNAGVGAVVLPLPLVMSSPDRGHVLRSVYESAAFAIRANLEQLERVSGNAVDRLRLGGGMSRSAVFPRIVADVIDRPVEVAASPETSAAGAAMLAAVAIGWYDSIDEAVRAMAGGRTVIEPEMGTSAEYEDYYARWCALADGMERMAGA